MSGAKVGGKGGELSLGEELSENIHAKEANNPEETPGGSEMEQLLMARLRRVENSAMAARRAAEEAEAESARLKTELESATAATEERNAVLEEINKAAECHVESCDVELLAGLLDEARSLGVDASNILEKGRELAAVQGDRAANVAAALIFSDEAHAIYDPLAPPRNKAPILEDISVLGPDL